MTESPTVLDSAINYRVELGKRKKRLETLGNYGKGVAQSAADSIQSGTSADEAATMACEVFNDFVERSDLVPDSLDSRLALQSFERHLVAATGVRLETDTKSNGEIS